MCCTSQVTIATSWPPFPTGEEISLTALCLYCKLIHSMYLWAVCGWFNICSSFPSALSLHLQKKDGMLLTAGVATSSWMPLMITAVRIIPCLQLFASPVFLEFRYMFLLGTSWNVCPSSLVSSLLKWKSSLIGREGLLSMHAIQLLCLCRHVHYIIFPLPLLW